jgi:hypothetical protein
MTRAVRSIGYTLLQFHQEETGELEDEVQITLCVLHNVDGLITSLCIAEDACALLPTSGAQL